MFLILKQAVRIQENIHIIQNSSHVYNLVGDVTFVNKFPRGCDAPSTRGGAGGSTRAIKSANQNSLINFACVVGATSSLKTVRSAPARVKRRRTRADCIEIGTSERQTTRFQQEKHLSSLLSQACCRPSMGIQGLFHHLGPAPRISVAKLAADHYVRHKRPFRLAIDISIWLFQIQSGKGGSNPALRTFYYRLLRLLALNIHPLFVFDGPNKPEWKRGKRVGGPGAKVVSVPEFNAKQLLKLFGFPLHVAPGEAEAECAVLQREGVVDAVLSEDVDTLMFGSGMTLRHWSADGNGTTPTHVNVFHADETQARSGLDHQGMILVALMSGGDYIPTGIPGCGPKTASDAAKAGFGASLCRLKRKDVAGLAAWKEELTNEIRTNERKLFSRKTKGFTMPEDFPSWEVLGYYTHPCVSTREKIAQLRTSIKWDEDLDFAALRAWAGDAFDWSGLVGAYKFVKNLAPALLMRNIRMGAHGGATKCSEGEREQPAQVLAIHGKRTHATTDGLMEYRISFTPAEIVPLDFDQEEQGDELSHTGGGTQWDDESDAEAESAAMVPSTSPSEDPPPSPTKKRVPRPFYPHQPDKVWALGVFLQAGCPLLVDKYENPPPDPREFLKAQRKAKAAARGQAGATSKAKAAQKKKKKKKEDMPRNALLQYATITKPRGDQDGRPMKELTPPVNEQFPSKERAVGPPGDGLKPRATFQLPSSGILSRCESAPRDTDVAGAKQNQPAELGPPPSTGLSAPFAAPSQAAREQRTPQKTKKRPSAELGTPATNQKSITKFYSPSPRKAGPTRPGNQPEMISLLSSSPERGGMSPPRRRTEDQPSFLSTRAACDAPPPGSIPKRVRKAPRRWLTAPVQGGEVESVDSAELLPANLRVDLDGLDAGQSLRRLHPAPRRVRRSASVACAIDATDTFAMLAPPPGAVEQPSQSPTCQPLSGAALPARTSHSPTRTEALRRRPEQTARHKSRAIVARASLEGAYKVVEVEELDLTGDGGGGGARTLRVGARMAWRASGVEVLDLTES